jgi:hypothetical protein
MIVGQELFSEVGSDEPRAPGDENIHLPIFYREPIRL